MIGPSLWFKNVDDANIYILRDDDFTQVTITWNNHAGVITTVVVFPRLGIYVLFNMVEI